MPRVVGIDPGTVSLDVCGLDDGRARSSTSRWPTADALADPEPLRRDPAAAGGPPDLVAGPSGYGLPLRPARARERGRPAARLPAPPGEPGGIGGLRALARMLGRAGLAGGVHARRHPPRHRARRIASSTGSTSARPTSCAPPRWRSSSSASAPAGRWRRSRSSLLELGGAFTAAIAVQRGQIVDGLGGTSGPIGWQAAGALDGEVAYLAGGRDRQGVALRRRRRDRRAERTRRAARSRSRPT